MKSFLVGEEWSAEGLVATAAAAVLPFHLHHPVVAGKGLVETSAVCCRLGRTELEVALVGIFVSGGIEPGVQVGVGDGFFTLMGNDIHHAIGAANSWSRTVWAGGLDFASGGTTVRIS